MAALSRDFPRCLAVRFAARAGAGASARVCVCVCALARGRLSDGISAAGVRKFGSFLGGFGSAAVLGHARDAHCSPVFVFRGLGKIQPARSVVDALWERREKRETRGNKQEEPYSRSEIEAI